MAYLINTRWIDIPEDRIFQQLYTLGITSWEDKKLSVAGSSRHYLFGGPYAYPYSLPSEVVNRLSERLNEAKHMTWYRDYNTQAIAHFEEHGEALNQAAEYWKDYGDENLPKPIIMPISGLSPGTEYIAVIGLFHLSGAENRGNHHLYIDLVDQDGNRIYEPVHFFIWGWEDMTQEQAELTSPVRVDKPLNEPGANIGIQWGQVVFGFELARLPADRISGIHIRYGDTDEEGNHQGHHSHYVVLQKKVYGEPIDPPDPDPPDLVAKGFITLKIDKEYLNSLPVDGQGKITLIVPIYR